MKKFTLLFLLPLLFLSACGKQEPEEIGQVDIENLFGEFCIEHRSFLSGMLGLESNRYCRPIELPVLVLTSLLRILFFPNMKLIRACPKSPFSCLFG